MTWSHWILGFAMLDQAMDRCVREHEALHALCAVYRGSVRLTAVLWPPMSATLGQFRMGRQMAASSD